MNEFFKKIGKSFLIFIGIVCFMFLPAIIPFSYQFFMGLGGIDIHDGNSSIFSALLYLWYTIPIGLVALLVFGVRGLIKFFRS